MQIECITCGKILDLKEIRPTYLTASDKMPRYRELYDHYVDSVPTLYYFCSRNCETKFISDEHTDFYYDICEKCEREICIRWPEAGHILNFDYNGELFLCKKCAERK